jgi:hypothetical protein
MLNFFARPKRGIRLRTNCSIRNFHVSSCDRRIDQRLKLIRGSRSWTRSRRSALRRLCARVEREERGHLPAVGRSRARLCVAVRCISTVARAREEIAKTPAGAVAQRRRADESCVYSLFQRIRSHGFFLVANGEFSPGMPLRCPRSLRILQRTDEPREYVRGLSATRISSLRRASKCTGDRVATSSLKSR